MNPKSGHRLATLLFAALLALPLQGGAEESDDDFDAAFGFDDDVLEEPIQYPDWFKVSFLDLRDDMAEALAEGKRGIAVYFGQKRCAYCQALMEVNFGKDDIVTYTREHFNFIPIDIWGIDEVTDLNGVTLTEREYSIREGTNFTPSIIFYDAAGDIALRLRGYYPPYKFNAALRYVAEGDYLEESFPSYLERADPPATFEEGGMNEQDFFMEPPYLMARNRVAASRPLVVFFEQGDCHACDILHTEPLSDSATGALLEEFDAFQLSIWSNARVLTPDGRRTTAREWARQLGIFYTPTILFFDEHGREILRIDSVVRFHRLRNVLRYVLQEGYKRYPNYQVWRARSGF